MAEKPSPLEDARREVNENLRAIATEWWAGLADITRQMLRDFRTEMEKAGMRTGLRDQYGALIDDDTRVKNEPQDTNVEYYDSIPENCIEVTDRDSTVWLRVWVDRWRTFVKEDGTSGGIRTTTTREKTLLAEHGPVVGTRFGDPITSIPGQPIATPDPEPVLDVSMPGKPEPYVELSDDDDEDDDEDETRYTVGELRAMSFANLRTILIDDGFDAKKVDLSSKKELIELYLQHSNDDEDDEDEREENCNLTTPHRSHSYTDVGGRSEHGQIEKLWCPGIRFPKVREPVIMPAKHAPVQSCGVGVVHDGHDHVVIGGSTDAAMYWCEGVKKALRHCGDQLPHQRHDHSPASTYSTFLPPVFQCNGTVAPKRADK